MRATALALSKLFLQSLGNRASALADGWKRCKTKYSLTAQRAGSQRPEERLRSEALLHQMADSA